MGNFKFDVTLADPEQYRKKDFGWLDLAIYSIPWLLLVVGVSLILG